MVRVRIFSVLIFVLSICVIFAPFIDEGKKLPIVFLSIPWSIIACAKAIHDLFKKEKSKERHKDCEKACPKNHKLGDGWIFIYGGQQTITKNFNKKEFQDLSG